MNAGIRLGHAAARRRAARRAPTRAGVVLREPERPDVADRSADDVRAVEREGVEHTGRRSVTSVLYGLPRSRRARSAPSPDGRA